MINKIYFARFKDLKSIVKYAKEHKIYNIYISLQSINPDWLSNIQFISELMPSKGTLFKINDFDKFKFYYMDELESKGIDFVLDTIEQYKLNNKFYNSNLEQMIILCCWEYNNISNVLSEFLRNHGIKTYLLNKE